MYSSSDNARHPVLYILHSAEMYGTERMALATGQGLSQEFRIIFIGPEGPATWEAQRLGFETHYFQSSRELIQVLGSLFECHPSLTIASTLPRFSLISLGLNLIYRRQIKQVCIIHGSCDEKRDYGFIKPLIPFNITLVAVSEYVREKLIAHDMPPHRIEVVLNFMPPQQIKSIAKRGLFTTGIRRAISIGRAEPAKRLDLLLDAVHSRPELAEFPIDILGHGDLLDSLRSRAQDSQTAVQFLGFVQDIEQRYATADLLIHPCPSESFGLVVIEAMAARIPVLVADRGGPATFVEDGVTGFKYRAGDPNDLARRLVELRQANPQLLNQITFNAARELEARFSGESSLNKYRQVFAPSQHHTGKQFPFRIGA